MKKIVQVKESHHRIDAVQVANYEKKVLGTSDVRVDMHLSPIHHHDLMQLSGTYGHRPTLPHDAGTEALGVIAEVGSDVKHLAVGQRVIATGGIGTWADEFVADANSVVPLPDGIADEIAAQLISMPFSALTLLRELGVSSGDWLLYNAAGGAIGKLLATIGKAKGLKLIGLVHRDNLVAPTEKYGADLIVSTTQDHWQEAVREKIGNEPILYALDSVGGELAGKMADLLGYRGTFMTFGAMSEAPYQFSYETMIFKELRIKGFWGAVVAEELTAEDFVSLIEEIMGYALEGKLELPVSAIYPVDEIEQALKASESTSNGKVLLKGANYKA